MTFDQCPHRESNPGTSAGTLSRAVGAVLLPGFDHVLAGDVIEIDVVTPG